MDQPAHRGPVELAISRVDRRIVLQHILQHVKVAGNAAPCSGMAPCCDNAVTGKPRRSMALRVATLLLRAASATWRKAFPDALDDPRNDC